MVAINGLLSTLKVRKNRHSGLDPESPQTFRNVQSSPVDKGILNRVQDDEGTAAYAASLRSDRFGSDSTNDKQLSLASRVSHSGLDPESPQLGQRFQSLTLTRMNSRPQKKKGILNQVQDDEGPSTSNMRRVLSPDNTLNAPFTTSHHTHFPHPTHSDGWRSCTFHHGFVGIGGTRPTLREAYQPSSLNGTLASAPYPLPTTHYPLHPKGTFG